MRVLGISGSLRSDSHNGRLLRAAAALLPPEAEFVQFDRPEGDPAVRRGRRGRPRAAVEHWREAIADADALLFATPEYNHSIPGALKNAVDWASRPFATAALRNKPAATIGASTGMFGAVWAQAELRKSLAAAGARVIDRELPIGEADEAFARRRNAGRARPGARAGRDPRRAARRDPSVAARRLASQRSLRAQDVGRVGGEVVVGPAQHQPRPGGVEPAEHRARQVASPRRSRPRSARLPKPTPGKRCT